MFSLKTASVLICTSVLMVCPLRSEAAVATHLDVDFRGYTLGSVKGQSEPGAGTWTGGASWFGSVVSATYGAGSQALEVYKTASGSGGRGSVAMGSGVSLSTANKIYWAFDFNLKGTTSNIEMRLTNGGSEGTVANLGFGVRINGTGNKLAFATSTEGGSLVMTEASSFALSTDTWYRLELEITQGTTAGQGTFSVYASSEANPTRTLILGNQAYSFSAQNFTTYTATPGTTGASSTAMLVNNLIVQSGLEEFPIHQIPEGNTVAYVLFGAAGLLGYRLRR